MNAEHGPNTSNRSFLCSRVFAKVLKQDIKKLGDAFDNRNGDLSFHGTIVDTEAKRSSVMCFSQYRVCCSEFGIPSALSALTVKHIRRIDGGSKSIGKAVILIPFPELLIDVGTPIQIMEYNIPTPRIRKDLENSGIHLSVQNE